MRPRILAAAAGLALLWIAGPAVPAGLAGVELTPDKGPTDPATGPATAFHVRVPDGGATQSGFLLRNLVDTPRTVRIYAAEATGTPPDLKVGGPGGARWIDIADQEVTLTPGESRRVTFRITDPGAPRGTEVYGAVVMEAKEGSVVTRAATVVYAEVGPPPRSLAARLSWLLVALGIAALAVALTGFVARGLRLRRRRLRRQRASSPRSP